LNEKRIIIATNFNNIPLHTHMITLSSCRSVDNYKKLNEIEEGTYGLVFRAQCKQTGAIVALKKLKLSQEREGFPVTSLREIATLLSSHHPNIVNVREVVVGRELGNVFIVMDYMDHDLRTLMDSNL
jgi:cell division cycle 2-like